MQKTHSTRPSRQRKNSTSSSSSLGSLEDVDLASEDFNRDEQSRATGHMGKNSEVVWMQRLDTETKTADDDNVSIGDSLASMNYHLDDRMLPARAVQNPFILPPKPLSDRLLQIYLDRVQISMPFIRRDLFCDQHRRCYIRGSVNPGRKWLAIFNLVLAIGCVFSRLNEEDILDADENIFFARAQSLCAPETILYEHDDLQQVQAEGLLAFFYLTISQINR